MKLFRRVSYLLKLGSWN